MRLMLFGNRFVKLKARISDKFTLPDRFKGTFVEKWANYWRFLINDYSNVAMDILKDARAKPMKSLVIGTTSYALYASHLRNPGEVEFMEALRNYNNQMIIVPPTLQNPESTKYITELEQAVNQNTIRTLSLGICTLVWIDLYDKDDCTYPAICEYTKVGYWNFHERVIDVGFWNRFWRLDMKMRNFDVNYLNNTVS